MSKCFDKRLYYKDSLNSMYIHILGWILSLCGFAFTSESQKRMERLKKLPKTPKLPFLAIFAHFM